MTGKKLHSVLVPYIIKRGTIKVFLQKRSSKAKRLPNYFGFFGGHLEKSENPEQGMLREIKEELNYLPKNYHYLGVFEFERSIRNVYYMKASDDFETNIAINKTEGQYGKYFSEEEALNEPMLIDEDKTVIRALFKKLK